MRDKPTTSADQVHQVQEEDILVEDGTPTPRVFSKPDGTPLESMVAGQYLARDTLAAAVGLMEQAGIAVLELCPPPPWRQRAAEHIAQAIIEGRRALNILLRRKIK